MVPLGDHRARVSDRLVHRDDLACCSCSRESVFRLHAQALARGQLQPTQQAMIQRTGLGVVVDNRSPRPVHLLKNGKKSNLK